MNDVKPHHLRCLRTRLTRHPVICKKAKQPSPGTFCSGLRGDLRRLAPVFQDDLIGIWHCSALFTAGQKPSLSRRPPKPDNLRHPNRKDSAGRYIRVAMDVGSVLQCGPVHPSIED